MIFFVLYFIVSVLEFLLILFILNILNILNMFLFGDIFVFVQAFDLFGQQLLQADHFASSEVEERLEGMAGAREDLEKAWIARRMQLDQCLELQLFYRLSKDLLQMFNSMFFTYLFSKVSTLWQNIQFLRFKSFFLFSSLKSDKKNTKFIFLN